MSAKKTLSDAFHETLNDVFFAEKHSVKACKKSAKASTLPELKQAFENHAVESSVQVERLTHIFELIGKPARAKTCEATLGIIAEMGEDIAEFGHTLAADAVIIGCGQALAHYEIARYGMLKTWASQLGMSEAAKLLDETLQEEKKVDALLTQIAEKRANVEAQGAKSK